MIICLFLLRFSSMSFHQIGCPALLYIIKLCKKLALRCGVLSTFWKATARTIQPQMGSVVLYGKPKGKAANALPLSRPTATARTYSIYRAGNVPVTHQEMPVGTACA